MNKYKNKKSKKAPYYSVESWKTKKRQKKDIDKIKEGVDMDDKEKDAINNILDVIKKQKPINATVEIPNKQKSIIDEMNEKTLSTITIKKG